MENISSALLDPLDEPSMQYIRLCLLAPCTINISTSWFGTSSIQRLMLAFWTGFFLLRRIFPRFHRIRTTNLLFYAVGIGTKPTILNRRELLVLILYGLTFTSILNLFEARQMAFVTVIIQRTCYETVQGVYHSNIRVKLHPELNALIVTEFDPRLEERIVLDNYTGIDLTTQQFAYVLGCDVARTLAKTVSNYNPELDLFMMAVIEEPVASAGIPLVQEKYTPETGILEYEFNTYTHQKYRHSQGTKDRQVDQNLLLSISMYFALCNSLAIVIFCLEIVSKIVNRDMITKILKMICSIKTLKSACLKKSEKGKNIKHIKFVEPLDAKLED